jgi:hypothetical protein
MAAPKNKVARENSMVLTGTPRPRAMAGMAGIEVSMAVGRNMVREPSSATSRKRRARVRSAMGKIYPKLHTLENNPAIKHLSPARADDI